VLIIFIFVVMANVLWDEMIKCKQDYFYSLYLLEYKKNARKQFAMVTLVISGVCGVICWIISQSYFRSALIVVCLFQCFRVLEPKFVADITELPKLKRLIDFYSDYYNTLEQLWYGQRNHTLKYEEVKAKFDINEDYRIEINSLIEELINKNFRPALYDKAVVDAEEYLHGIANKPA